MSANREEKLGYNERRRNMRGTAEKGRDEQLGDEPSQLRRPWLLRRTTTGDGPILAMVRHYMMTHPPPDPFARAEIETRAASWNTSVTPRLCFALHSR